MHRALPGTPGANCPRLAGRACGLTPAAESSLHRVHAHRPDTRWRATSAVARTIRPSVRHGAPGPHGSTAEPSGELSKGDVVAVGEAGLAVASVGWTPVRGGLNEVRTSEHGTRPLPACRRLPDSADRTAIPWPDQGAT